MLYVTVFFSGLTTLALELLASRLLAPYFGTSNLVWAAVIGLILLYLTLGYRLGGRWADRSPYLATLYRILAWGAFLGSVIPFVARPVLLRVASAFDQMAIGVLPAAFVGVLVLFSVPLTLLGMVSPFAIRLALQDAHRAGTVSGNIYALSTIGSFVGTFLPDLVFVPWIGTRGTFLLFGGLLLLVAFAGLWRAAGPRALFPLGWMPLVWLILLLWAARLPIKTTPGQVFETESSYNYIQVLEDADGTRSLRLNEGQGIHSVYHPQRIAFGGTWQQFLAAPFFSAPPVRLTDVDSMAIIGLAAGTSARQATAVFGPIPIDGYEIDPEIIRVGQRYFGMTETNLHAIPQDGRIGLAHSQTKYALIAIDAYRPPYIPWHLTTREFFETVRAHLKPNGAVAINVGRAPNDRRLIEALAGTMQAVFPSVFVMDVPNTFNTIVYATASPTSWENLAANYAALSESEASPVLLDSIARAWTYQQPTPPVQQVFTDDRAPIEWLTNALIFGYVLGGGR
ncbi:MAG: fused MFS/spermidine synthase [Anaerolineales bacterium]